MLTTLSANVTGMTLAGSCTGCSKILCVEVEANEFFTQILNQRTSADSDLSLFEEVVSKRTYGLSTEIPHRLAAQTEAC